MADRVQNFKKMGTRVHDVNENLVGDMYGLHLKTAAVQRNMDLTGKRRFLVCHDKTLSDSYAFVAEGKAVPVEIIQECKDTITCKVLPHMNPNPKAFEPSKPYTVSIRKFDLLSKRFELSESEPAYRGAENTLDYNEKSAASVMPLFDDTEDNAEEE